MRFRTLAIAAALAAGISTTGSAYAPQKGADRPVVAAGRAPRLHRDVTWHAPQGALAALPKWQALWDRDTDVPLRLWGPSINAPGTSTSAAAAETFARSMLAQHIALLAPGATASDFVLVSNSLDPSGTIRTLGFYQRALGLTVVGGAVSFTFSHDRLVAMGSTALPKVSARLPQTSLPVQTIASAAKSWLGSAGYAVDVKAYGERVIVPIVRSRGHAGAPVIEYRVAETVSVESSREPGAWQVWIDANDASPIARASTLSFASGKILYDTPDRHPAGTRSAKPAPKANHMVAGTPTISLMDGTVTWSTTGSVQVGPGLVGPVVRVSNKAGALITDALTLAPDATVTWSKASDEFADAQLTAFVAASVAKDYAKTRLNPTLAWLDGQIPVVVNESSTCNAYSTGNDIHFFRKGAQCENTGRLVDVVYHEFGHSLHRNSIIPGVGSWDGALSEGLADVLASAITHDHGMGRGFFFTDSPLRNLDPDGYEKKWPDDVTGEVHDDGEIIGGTLWDLRKALEAKLGAQAGDERVVKIFYAIMQRASDIPSSYLEALVTDDDDGNLANGTPNQCEINAAFGAHGLVDPSISLGLQPPVRDGYKVSVTIKTPEVQSECPPPTVSSATLTWTPSTGYGTEVPLTASGDTYSASIPVQPDGTVIKYRVTLAFSDGSSISYPQNAADPEYQMYAGNVESIWCADFETGLGDWVIGGTPSTRIEWEVGAPQGLAGDPKSAHGGVNVLGMDIGSDDGLYSPRTTQYVESPEIDLAGHTQVRLQYWRWLNVEDGVYDPTTIAVNGTTVWQNKTGDNQEDPGTSHTDREWRFHDIDLKDHTSTGKVKLRFQTISDAGFELAGWNVDDVCLVIAGPPTTCEQNGTCEEPPPEDTGCCSTGTSPTGAVALSLLTLGFVVRRRRRK